jgi:TetR/AcrR family transcriptional regulator, lmrAB and yxaGH operons repressor
MVATMGRLLRAQGFHATGLNQVLADSGTPKGSLYHYFPGGKDQLAAEAIRAAGKDATEAFQQAFELHRPAATAMQAVVAWMAAELERSDFRYGCPIATVALEAASVSTSIRTACDETYRAWQAVIVARLCAEGRTTAPASADAALVLSALEGALILSRAARDVRPLTVLAERMPELLRSKRAAR